jgi:release factor glutamine methyltransferase
MILKTFLNYTYRPILQNYLRRDREFNYKGNQFVVRRGVFHPGFFFSTSFLLEEMEMLHLEDKALLELGCGSGVISVIAAKSGAKVTASDISPLAISCTGENAANHKVELSIINSDLFDSIPPQQFDFIIINPPYYRGKADNFEKMSWYCGDGMEYFEKLFKQIGNYFHNGSLIFMVLSEDCELNEIKRMAREQNFKLVLDRTKTFWWERNFIFEIRKAGDSVSEQEKGSWRSF